MPSLSRLAAVALLPLACTATHTVTQPQSLDKFKIEYTAEKADWSGGAALLSANKEIQGSATPTDADIEKLWLWYHAVSGEVQTNAKAYMVEAETGAQALLLSDFITKLNTAIPKTTSTDDIKNYVALMGATKPVSGGGVLAATVDAWVMLHHLSSADQASMRATARARMLESYKVTWAAAQGAGINDYAKTMEFIGFTTGGIDTTGNTKKEQDSHAVYKDADADLKKSIDALLVDFLKTKIA